MANYHNRGKLVRDRIPEIITSSGQHCAFETITGSRLTRAMADKLTEELEELLAASSQEERTEEGGDVLEVVRSLLEQKGVTYEEAEEARRKKYQERGGFTKGVFLTEW